MIDDEKLVRVSDVRELLARAFAKIGITDAEVQRILKTPAPLLILLEPQQIAVLTLLNFMDKIERLGDGEGIEKL